MSFTQPYRSYIWRNVNISAYFLSNLIKINTSLEHTSLSDSTVMCRGSGRPQDRSSLWNSWFILLALVEIRLVAKRSRSIVTADLPDNSGLNQAYLLFIKSSIWNVNYTVTVDCSSRYLHMRIPSFLSSGSLHAVLRTFLLVPLQAWSSPEGSRKLRFPNFMTKLQDDGKVVSLMHRSTLPQEMFLVIIYVRG